MGAYFRCYKKYGVIRKTLIHKKNGSSYPSIEDFNEKIGLLRKYLGNFVVDTKIVYDGKFIRLEQPFVSGEDIFKCLKDRKLKGFDRFLQGLNDLYSDTEMLPDLINEDNILVTDGDEIKIVDVWPLFFEQRVKDGDITSQSHQENLDRFYSLKNTRVQL